MTGPVVIDSRAVEPGALFVALPGSASTATTSRRGRRAPAPSRCSPGASSTSRAPCVVVGRPCRPRSGGSLAARAAVDRRPRRLHASSGSPAPRARPAPRTCSRVLAAAGPTVAPAGLLQQRARPAADRAAGRRGDPVLVARDGRARRRAHRLPDADRPAATSASCSTSAAAHLGEFGCRGGDRPGQGRAGRGAAGRTGSPCSTPTTRGCAAMAARTRARVVPFGAVRRRGRAGRGRPAATTGSAAVVHAAHARRATARPVALRAARRAPRRQRARRRRRRAGAAGCAVGADRRSAVAARGRPAAGGWRSPTRRRRHRRQRRLQRQPRLGARRAALRDAGRDGAGPATAGGPGRCSARCSSSARPPATSTTPSAARRPARRLAGSSRSARAPARSHAGAAQRGPGVRSRCWCPTWLPRWRCCAPSCAPGDVVLVKASRSVGLETVATARWPTCPPTRPADAPAPASGRRPREGRPLRGRGRR